MSVKITINDKQLNQLSIGMRKAPISTTKLLERTVAAAQFVLQKNTIKNDPVPYDTGFLLMSFRYQQPLQGSSNRLMARWFPTIQYAVFVDQGTSKQRGQFFMKKIEKKSRPEIERLFDTAARKISTNIIKK